MKLPGWYWRAHHRTQNRWMDLVARLHGACNASTWDPLRKTWDPGYSHWRCGREAEHIGPHRFNNYTWWYRGSSKYDPIPVRSLDDHQADMDAAIPKRRWTDNRHGTPPRGRQRAYHREMELRLHLRKGARLR